MPRKGEKSGNTFEQDQNRLEEIVARLESGLPIEEAVTLYQEGIQLSRRLEERLTDIERKIYEVKNIAKLSTGEDREPDISLFHSDEPQQ
jgi:exodeoxyribonuclease VII small subunit